MDLRDSPVGAGRAAVTQLRMSRNLDADGSIGTTGAVRVALAAVSTIADFSAPADKRQAAALELSFLASCRAEVREAVLSHAETLLDVLARDDTPPTVLSGAIMAMVQCANDDAQREKFTASVPSLAKLLTSSDPEVQAASALMLARLSGSERVQHEIAQSGAVDRLQRLEVGNSAYARDAARYAQWALRVPGGVELKPALVQARRTSRELETHTGWHIDQLAAGPANELAAELATAHKKIAELEKRLSGTVGSSEPPVPRAPSPSPAPPARGDTTGGWTAKGWLLSLAPEVSDVVASALGVSVDGADEFAALRSLSDETVAARLTEAGLPGLVPVITRGVGKLREQAAATGAELNSKFSDEQGTFELAFGSTDTFYGGLEVTPAPRGPQPIPTRRSSTLAHTRPR